MFLQSSLPLVLILAAPAPQLPTLQWKFREGEVFYLRTVTTTKQSMVVMGKTVAQNQESSSVHRYTVKKINRDGSVEIEMLIENLALTVEVGGGPPQPLVPRVRGSSFQFTLNARREITHLEGYQAFLNKLPEADKTVLSSILTEDTLKESLAEVFSVFPAKRVSPGDSWERTSRVHMGPVGVLEARNRYRYEGKPKVGDKVLDRISWESEMRFTHAPPPAPGQNQFPFQVTKGDLKAEGFKGTHHFDPVAGRLRDFSASYRIKGKLTVDAGGTTIDIDLDQQTETKTVVSREAPR